MLSLRYHMQQARPWVPTQSQFNSMTREALRAAALFWLREFRPLHFAADATQRYGYAPRSARWQAIKARARKVFNAPYGAWVAAHRPPQDLIWSGNLRRAVVDKPVAAFNVRATATATRATVRVGIPLGRPPRGEYYSARVAAEVVKLIDAEIAACHKVASEHLWRQVRAGQVIPADQATAARAA